MEEVKVLGAGVFKGHTLYLTTPIHTKFAWMKQLISLKLHVDLSYRFQMPKEVEVFGSY